MSNLFSDYALEASVNINTKEIQARYPLIAMEKGLFFHAQYYDNPSFYLSQGEYFLENIDPQLFWNAWEQVIHRYEALRSCFVENHTGVIQHIIYSHAACAINMINLSTFPGKHAEKEYQKILEQEIKTPFDLTKPPLMRLVLCQMSPKKYRFIWTHHHLLLDLRSAF